MTSGGAKRQRASSKRAGLTDRLRELPPWISAFTAVLAVILSAIGVFGLISHPTPSVAPSSPGTDAGTAGQPRVTLETVVVGGQTVEGIGAFERVNPALSDIVFIGRPADAPSDTWLATEANMTPLASAATGALDGRWSAARALPTTPYQWYAILWPAAAGAAGSEDLTLNGPDSEFVQAKSSPQVAP
jgi:hypothetical protein